MPGDPTQPYVSMILSVTKEMEFRILQWKLWVEERTCGSALQRVLPPDPADSGEPMRPTESGQHKGRWAEGTSKHDHPASPQVEAQQTLTHFHVLLLTAGRACVIGCDAVVLARVVLVDGTEHLPGVGSEGRSGDRALAPSHLLTRGWPQT